MGLQGYPKQHPRSKRRVQCGVWCARLPRDRYAMAGAVLDHRYYPLAGGGARVATCASVPSRDTQRASPSSAGAIGDDDRPVRSRSLPRRPPPWRSRWETAQWARFLNPSCNTPRNARSSNCHPGSSSSCRCRPSRASTTSCRRRRGIWASIRSQPRGHSPLIISRMIRTPRPEAAGRRSSPHRTPLRTPETHRRGTHR